MLPPPWPLPLRHSHSCLYTRSVFERKKMNCDTVVIHVCTRGLSFFDLFLFFASFVRGTPTTHSEGLLLRVGALPCANTYNRGVVQSWSSIVWGLHSHTNAARRPQFTMQTALQLLLLLLLLLFRHISPISRTRGHRVQGAYHPYPN